jgi:(S)-2-hydroxyglutarate dehydrogenase
VPSDRFDVAVVGGGLVGLASALALSESGRSVALLEAEPRVAAHQSGRNSGVIHAGLYYRPGSLRARLCREGREALYAFCEAEGVPAVRSGKVIVATSERELPALEELARRAEANGLAPPERLDGEGVRALEPAVAAIAGLWIAETGLVDFAAVAGALAGRLERRGVSVLLGSRVQGVRVDAGGVTVRATHGQLIAGHLVNCGGLQADRLARVCGVEPFVRIIPFRGEYWELVPAARDLVRHPVYPVPNPAFPFLGVHLTPRIDGRVEAGPNAVLAWRREGYERRAFSARDAADMLSFPGFWRLLARTWRVGLGEMTRSWSRTQFLHALQRLVPSLRAEHLVPGGTGIRAQAVDASGYLVDDFVLQEGDHSLHVLNAPSPAATAALSIGREIAGRV